MSRVRFFAATAALLVGAASSGAETLPPGPWNFGVTGTLNLSQSAFSDNWSGGDKGNINWVLNGDFEAKRQLNAKFNWSNQLQLAYGQTSSQKLDPASPGKKRWAAPDKTTDLVLLESVGRWTLGGWADPYAAFRLDSQFQDDSDPIGKLLFNPVKVAETAGIARPFIQEEEREVISRIGFGFRQSFARSFTDATGDATESFSTNDGGVEFQTDAKLPLADDRILYTSKLQVFWPVFYSASGDLEDFDALVAASGAVTGEAVADFWKSPDVNWQNTFTSEVTSWLNVNLYVQWVYDKFNAATKVDVTGADTDDAVLQAVQNKVLGGVRKGGQFKQTIGVGLTYRFL
ncbi:MAG: hypothetical protein DHS20C21_03260 [Gemmatimonadota bacterium]|nr:MAG: hypothetical protein DHS20C21_03260 [Gemmatimonadota bacterium]